MTTLRVLALSLLVLLGCRGDKGDPEARTITLAYEAFQGASATDRPAALTSLQQLGCKKLCAERDACASYAKHLLRAQQLVQKAHELGPEDAGGNGAASETELAIIVEGADDASKKATAAEPTCRTALERLYALGRK
jgi:hypothetical protein